LLITIQNVLRATKNAQKGHFLPPASRLQPAPAPGGTRIETTPYGFQIAHHTLPVENLKQAVRVLQISDVHIRQPSRKLERLIQGLETVQADLVVLTGDILTRESSMPAVHRFLAHLPETSLGSYAIMGNWEYCSGYTPHHWSRILATHGITLLHNQSCSVGGLCLVGLDDEVSGQPDLWAIPTESEQPVVVLAHCPATFDEAQLHSPDLVLSGHTHGGQIHIPSLGTLWTPKGSGPYVHGFYFKEQSALYVSSGLGWSIAPLRSKPPEVAIHHLVPAGQPAQDESAPTAEEGHASSTEQVSHSTEQISDEDNLEDNLEVQSEQLAAWLADNEPLTLLDVREPYECASGHATDALLIPMNSIPDQLDTLPKTRLVVYCAHGVRSYSVAHWLREQGLTQAFSLAGGFPAFTAVSEDYRVP
jgi:hypothetical protein